MRAGWYVSFSGIASFKSFGAVDLLRQVPLDRLMVETDSPYLAPVPNRGKRNEPAFVRYVAEAVASLLGLAVSLILVSFAYQRFVVHATPKEESG